MSRDGWHLTHTCGGERRELVACRRPGADTHEVLCVECGEWARLTVTAEQRPGSGEVIEVMASKPPAIPPASES